MICADILQPCQFDPSEPPYLIPPELLMYFSLRLSIPLLAVLFFASNIAEVSAFQDVQFATLQRQFENSRQAMLKRYCLDCHSTQEKQGELDLERFRSVSDIRGDVIPWQRAVEVLDDREMPPEDAQHQPTSEERAALTSWIRSVLDADARANSGDPGPVVLRRLNNAELTYTIEDLTGVALRPAEEFPVDSAAGEGFTNVGNALVMSPSLVQKYLDAAKGIASHAMLLPGGIEFSPSTTSRDWTNEKLEAIRKFYARYSDSDKVTSVTLQGIPLETNGGGRLPIEKYLSTLLTERQALTAGTRSLAEIARQSSLSQKYLEILWNALNATEPSPLLDGLRERWKTAGQDNVPELVRQIAQWQQSLWRFTTIGHIGKRDGPTAWQVPVTPLASRQEIRRALPPTAEDGTVTVYLSASDAGDGDEHDFALWQNPRFVSPGQPDLLLRDVQRAVRGLNHYRSQVISTAAVTLKAVAEIAEIQDREMDAAVIQEIAAKHSTDPLILSAWLRWLGIGAGEADVSGHMTQKTERAENYDFIKGWVGPDALSVIANSSETLVRVPGDVNPHSVAVHPTPTLRVTVGWKSPKTGVFTVKGRVQRAHLACGNGVNWVLEVKRGRTRQPLAAGVAESAAEAVAGPFENISLRAGDLVSLIIGPRDGNHSCDLTAVDLTISGEMGEWDLAKDVSPDILAGNPHPDRQGNNGVWHFFSEPDVAGANDFVIPQGSMMALWQSAEAPEQKTMIAENIQALMAGTLQPAVAADSPDALLQRQLTALNGPLLSAVRREILSGPEQAPADSNAPKTDSPEGSVAMGPDPSLFGKHPDGVEVAATDLCVKAPFVLKVTVPAELVAGCEFVATASLHQPSGQEGSVQMRVLAEAPGTVSGPVAGAANVAGGKATWSDGEQPLVHEVPILICDGSLAQTRLLAQFEQFRQLFPAALCYTRIVPVDEVVTLTLYYREDDQLRRLMLSESETEELNRLWREMHYVSRSPLALVDAYEQLWQFATQDADPSAFTPMRPGIMAAAEKFREELTASEPVHLEAVISLAGRAWRRPVTQSERDELVALYHRLRAEEPDHEQAIRMLLARIFVAPAFLYRSEQTQPGTAPTAISSAELATRLSYFLWSSLPDAELRTHADSGDLLQPETLRKQTRRLLSDARIRRMAIEFGCQWLHVRDFDQLDEKSEQHYPEFRELRADMYEETIRFFEDLIRNDRSVLSLLDADHVFVNGKLAAFYELEGAQGDGWQKLEGVRAKSRGGILTMASTLAKQSGASRTSPILRGNWVSEFLLGDKLPKPPKGVPVLPEQAPADVTERQLIEAHSSDPACAKCHQRIDPFGFALEQFDTIGKRRSRDVNGHDIDVATVLPDGTAVNGVEGLRNYLLKNRQDDFLHTFCKRLLGYALGRSVQLSDEPLLAEMILALQKQNYQIGAAIETIVLSPQFRMIRGADRDSIAAQE
ncbi:MAG: DUF1592 domain-containing protein [Planctomycetia bacterium]